jgi:hypothetical protein
MATYYYNAATGQYTDQYGGPLPPGTKPGSTDSVVPLGNTYANPLLPNSGSIGTDTVQNSNLNQSIGSADIPGPLTLGQQAELYNSQDVPGMAAAANAIINQTGALSSQTAPQLGTSPLAGLTTLGNVAQSGVNTVNPTTINTAQSNALTAGQIANINQLNATATGKGPSVAAIQAQQTGQQNIQNQMALLGSQRGSSNPSLGLRSAGNFAANANQQAVQAATLGRAQEELNAQNQLQTALGTTQNQVQQGAQSQAALNQTGNISNQTAANTIAANNTAAQNAAALQAATQAQQTNLTNQGVLQASSIANLGQQANTQQLNTAEYNTGTGNTINQANNQLTANENYAALTSGANLTSQGLADKIAINNTNNNLGLIGAGVGGVAATGGIVAAAASDRRLKTNIKSGNKSMKDFLSKIQPARQFRLMGE